MQYPPGSDYLGLYWVYTGKDYKSLGGFLENDNSIFYLVRGKVGLRAYLFNKSSGISYQINEPLLQNPLTFICVGAIPVTIHENKFVSPLPGYMVYLFNHKVKQHINNQGQLIKEEPIVFGCPRLEQIVRNSTENSNPVLKFFRYEFN